MALFTDSDVVTLDDLLQFESSLVQVSSTHGIDVETKIRLATDEIGDKLMLNLLQAGASDPQSSSRVELGLSTVVVGSALYRWLCFNSLSRIYAEAYNVQLNTRFQGKWTEYQQQANQAANMVTASGVGIVLQPLPKPATPSIAIAAGVIAAPALFGQIAWTDGHNQESALSPITGTVLNGASSVQVSASEYPTDIPANATGWNIYASLVQEKLTRQNETPIALGQSWVMPITGLILGSRPSGGQQPDVNVAFSKRLLRG